jgi:hypothetical protein
MVIHIPHTIRVRIPNASQVSLVGDFNNWQSSADPLVQIAPNTWERVIDLPAGRHRYGFHVIDDPALVQGAIKSRLVANGSVISVSPSLEESLAFPPTTTAKRLVA